jgi:hypothetical protein
MFRGAVECRGDGRRPFRDRDHSTSQRDGDVSRSSPPRGDVNEGQKDQHGETRVRSSLGKPSKSRSTNL